jgi:hypothetical protein
VSLVGEDIVLLCWEKPPKDCHRALVAEWLREAGFEVEEIPAEQPPKKVPKKPTWKNGTLW